MKQVQKRFLSVFMVLILVFSSLASSAYAAGGQQAENFTFLPAEPAVRALSESRLSELEGQEAVYFGTASVNLDEKDAYYSIPVFREGNLDTEASVSVLTMDVSASYGKDYEFSEEDVFVADEQQTLLEKGNGTNAIMTGEEMMEQVELAAKAYEEMYGENAEADETGETAAESGAGEEETAEETQSGSSWKETELGSVSKMLLQQMNIRETEEVDEEQLSASMRSDAIDFSAGMVLHFAKGEDRKTLVFHIFDDELEEGQEMFLFVLADAEGTVLRKQLTFSAVIEDNEELHDAVVSFSQKSYSSEKGKVTVKIIRTGSEYSMIDFSLRSCQDTAVPGENYDEINETVVMQPFQTEAEYSFEVAGQGRMEVMLVPETACQEGETVLAEVLIDVQETEEELKALRKAEELVDSLGEAAGIESGAAWQEVELSGDTEGTERRLGAGGADTFDITVDGKVYTVKYQNADDLKTVKQGAILDKEQSQLTNHDVIVGQYYFVSPYYFDYQQRYGYDSPADWGAYYISSNNLRNAKANIFWFTKTHCRTGGSYISSKEPVINSIYYSRLRPDWEGNNSRGYWHQFRFRTEFKSNGHYLESKVNEYSNGNFSRTVDSRAQINTWNSMEATELSFYAYAEDSGSAAPYNSLNVYGFACFYKVYACTLIPCSGLDYKTAKGGTLEAMLPFSLSTKSGIAVGEDHWMYLNEDSSNSTIVIATNEVKINGKSGVYGQLSYWDLIYGMNKGDTEKRTVRYPDHFVKYLKGEIGADWRRGSCLTYKSSTGGLSDEVAKRIEAAQSNLTNVTFDAYFAEYLQYLSYEFDGVHACDSGAIQLGFLPHAEYKKVKVRICDPMAPYKGRFADENLAVQDEYYEFNAGDTLDMTIVSEKLGQVAAGYQYSDDEGISWNSECKKKDYTIPGDLEGTIWLRPLFSEGENRIEIKYENGAENLVEVRGLISQDVLEDSKYKGLNILDIDPTATSVTNRMKPALGSIYTLEIVAKQEAPAGKAYCPYVIVNYYGTNPKKIYSQYFPLVGRGACADNVYAVGVDIVPKSSLKTYEIKGYVNRQSLASKVKSANPTQYKPAFGMTMIVSGQEKVNIDNDTKAETHYIQKVTSITDEYGNYTLTGVTGKPGTSIAVLAQTGLDNGNIQYIKLPEGEDTKVTAQTMTVTYPYDAPVVTSINYRYGDDENNNKTSRTTDTIQIYDDSLYFSLVVKEDQRKAEEVNLVIYHINANKETLTIPLTRQKEKDELTGEERDTDVWTGKLENMNKVLYNGDRLYTYVVDKEKKDLVVGKKADGTDEIRKMKITYPVMDTGYQFAEEIVMQIPQWLSAGLDETNRIDIPIAGSSGLPGATSGIISFNQYDWPDGNGFTRNVGIGISGSAMDVWLKGNRIANWKKSRIVAAQAANKKAEKLFGKSVDELSDSESIEVNNGLSELSNKIMLDDDVSESSLDKEEKKSKDLSLDEQLAENKKSLDKLNSWLDNPKGLTTETLGGADISVAFALHFVKVKNEYIYSCGELSIGVTVWVDHTKFMLLGSWLPAYVNIGGAFQIGGMQTWTTENGSLNAKTFKKIGGNISQVVLKDAGRNWAKVTIGMNAKVTVGLGLKDVLGVAGYVNAGWQGVYPVKKSKIPEGATPEEVSAIEKANSAGNIINFGGGIEVMLVLTKFTLNFVNIQKGFGSLADATELNFFGGAINKNKKTLGEEGLLKAAESEVIKVLGTDGNEEASLMKKYSGTSDMTGFGKASSDVLGNPEDGDYAAPVTLLSQAADDTAIQTVQTDEDGSLFMVFTGNRAGAEDPEEIDAIYWTSYDAGEDSWTVPQLLDADGIYEAVPDVSMKGKYITVTWSSAEDTFASETDFLDNLSKFRIKAAVFEVEDGGGVKMKVSPVFLSGQKASASIAKSEKSKGKDGSRYYDAVATTRYDETEGKLYSVMTRFDLSKAKEITDIVDPTVTGSRAFYAEYDLEEEDTERKEQGVLMELKDISLTVGDTVLNAADARLFEIEDEKGNIKEFMVVAYTQDTDGNLETEEDNELKLCLIEFTDTEEGMIVYPSISFPYTNGTSEYAKGEELILGDESFIVEDPDNYEFDTDMMKTVDYSNDTDGDGIEGIMLSNAELTEAAGTLWLTYLKDGYLYEMINIGEYLNEMFGEEYLAEMYRERALAENGGLYAVAPGELLTANEGNAGSWYQVSVEDLNEAWNGYVEFLGSQEGEDPEKAGRGAKWYSFEKEEKDAKLYGAGSNADIPDDALLFEASRIYAVSQGRYSTDETVLSADANSKASITDYQLVSNGKDVYIVYTDFPRNTTEPNKELFCVKKNLGYQDPEQEQKQETDYVPQENTDEIQAPESGDPDERCYYSKPVQLTNAGHVINGFKASISEDGEITVISECYDQWVPEEGGIKFSEKSIVETKYKPTAMPRIDTVQASASFVVDPVSGGQHIAVNYGVVNNGLESQDGYTSWVELDGERSDEFTFRKDGLLRSGDSDSYFAAIPVKDLKETRTVTIVLADSKGVVDEYSIDVEPKSRLVTDLTGISRTVSGSYQAAVTVYNSGSLASEPTNIKLRIQNDDYYSTEELKVYQTLAIPALKVGESKELLISFQPAPEDFTDLGTITLEAVLDGETVGSSLMYAGVDPDMAVIEDGAASLVLTRGTTRQLKATCEPFPEDTGEVLYYSADPEVASIDENGLLSSNKNGITTVYAYLPEWGYVDDILIVVRDQGTDDDNSSSTSIQLPSYVDRDGSWKQDANGNWTYTTRAGVKAADKWMAIARSTFGGGEGFEWFRFDKNGNLVTGWFRDSDDRMYYLQTISDGNKGRMLTDWQLIEGSWYYFNTTSDGYKGAMYRNRKTPDNYTVREDGTWDGKPNR